MVGYVQFKILAALEELQELDPTLCWEKKKISIKACMNYINTINTRENGTLKLVGEHWPIKKIPEQTDERPVKQRRSTKYLSVPVTV